MIFGDIPHEAFNEEGSLFSSEYEDELFDDQRELLSLTVNPDGSTTVVEQYTIPVTED